jgi:signal transduction histidine kinase
VRFGDELLLEVRDDGHGSANGNGTGSGLIGMRERVALLGGSVETGNAAGGGFLVSAQLPV